MPEDMMMMKPTNILAADLEMDEDDALDVARAKVKNQKLRTQVEETEMSIREMHDDHLQDTQKARDEITLLHQRADDYMDQFDLEGHKTVATPAYTPTDLAKICQVTVPLTEVDDLVDYIAPDVEAVRQALEELLAQKAGRQRRGFLNEDLKNIAAIHNNVDLVDIIVPLHDLNWSDLLNADAIWEQLNNTDAQVKQLQLKVEETDADRQDALNSDDMILSEQLHDQVLALLEEFMEVCRDRITIIKTVGCRPDLLARLEKFKKDAYATIDDFRNQQLNLKERIAEDMSRMDEHDLRMKAHDQNCVDEFEAFKVRNADDIDANEKDQNEVWDQILALYTAAKKMGEQRWDLINQRIDETEKEDNRKAEYDHMRNIHRDHYNTLINLRDKADDVLDLLQATEDYVNKAQEDIYIKTEQIEIEMANLLLDERKNFLSVFRRYYLTCGEIKYKKEKRQSAIDKNVRKHDENIETAKETLDPNTRRYKQAQADALRLREEITKKILIISNKMDKSCDEFEETESALNAAGVPFLHPTLELNEINVDRRVHLSQVNRKYASKENEELDEEDSDVAGVHQDTQAAKASGAVSYAVRSTSPSKRNLRRNQSGRRVTETVTTTVTSR